MHFAALASNFLSFSLGTCTYTICRTPVYALCSVFTQNIPHVEILVLHQSMFDSTDISLYWLLRPNRFSACGFLQALPVLLQLLSDSSFLLSHFILCMCMRILSGSLLPADIRWIFLRCTTSHHQILGIWSFFPFPFQSSSSASRSKGRLRSSSLLGRSMCAWRSRQWRACNIGICRM